MSRYHIYGFVLETAHPLVSFIEKADAAPDLTFTCSERLLNAPAEYECVYDSNLPGLGDEALFSLYRARDHYRLHYSGSADFYIATSHIHCHLLDDQYDYWVEIALLGPVMSFWLETRGFIALHASAVVIDGKAIGMMAASKSGKTSLAASMMQAGAALLSDDILPVSYTNGSVTAEPGYPQMRMWPDQARYFVGEVDALPLAHPDFDKRRLPVSALGTFHDQQAPLQAILLPERRSDVDELSVERMPGPAALFTLLQGSFAAPVIESMPEMQTRRLQSLARILQEVPVYHVRYPEGYDRLGTVRDHLLHSLDIV